MLNTLNLRQVQHLAPLDKVVFIISNRKTNLWAMPSQITLKRSRITQKRSQITLERSQTTSCRGQIILKRGAI